MHKINQHMTKDQLQILEAAALVHDIGIKLSEKKYGSGAEMYQEKEGPAEAQKMLRKLDFDENLIQRVCYLVGHHHSYADIQGMDYQILVEADLLVNLYEDEVTREGLMNAYNTIFRTESGKRLCREMYHMKND